ncbi:MAG: DUF2306 domain-containing protein [Caldilineaceae bacterium]
MEANFYGRARTPNLPKPPKTKARKFRSFWLVVALIMLSAIPLTAGALRLNQLASGAVITPENARFFAAPLPVVLHIVSVSFYAILGAFQFVPGLRQRRNRWHRLAGWFLIPCGLVGALSGLWMTLFYPWPKGDGVGVYGLRLLFGSAMLLSILLGVAAIQRRNFTQHGHWMLRGSAIGMGSRHWVLTGMVCGHDRRPADRTQPSDHDGRSLGDQPRRGGVDHPHPTGARANESSPHAIRGCFAPALSTAKRWN